jgi:RNA polymerase sigma-70 factor (ECF subfamily)
MDRYERPMFSLLITLLKDRDVAADCLQDTFLRAYEHLGKGRPVTGQWLYTVARHRAIDEFRSKRHEAAAIDQADAIPAVPGGSIRAEVWDALGALSVEDREILYLFLVDRFKTAEIGEMLGIKPTAVRMRLSRARDRFRQHYRGQA